MTTDSKQALARLDPQALIQTAVESGAGIETLERLVALARDVRAQQASEAWHHAMAEFQRTCQPIVKTRTAQIASKRTGSRYSYSYAPLGEIMQKILPVMGPLGLSVSFRVRHEAQQVIAVARVSHEMGHHEESGEVAMPVTQDDGTGANPAQRVGIASTYAKRYALLAIIGLTAEDDTDAHGAGDGSSREDHRAIQEPRRRSEAPPADARPAGDGDPGNVWQGVLRTVDVKEGQSQRGPWKLWTFTGTDGERFGTFSDTDADIADAFKKAGSTVEITFETTAKGNRNIVSIEEFEAGEI